VKLCFIGSGTEREMTQLDGIEVVAIASVMSDYFDTLVFGGSSVGIMEAFARAFAARGGRIISVVPRWLQDTGLVFQGCEPTYCNDLAARKHLMFDDIDAVLCYPGGLGTWDELFDLLARRTVEPEAVCPPVYLYNWQKYYAPLLLQIETALELGLIHPSRVEKIKPFESSEVLAKLLGAEHGPRAD